MKENDFRRILQFYGLHPESCTITEFLTGHINDSFIIDVRDKCSYFLQRINHHVFRDPEGLIENLIKVNTALNSFFGKENNPYPQIIQNRNKKYYYLDEEGNYWRMMEFVPGSRSEERLPAVVESNLSTGTNRKRIYREPESVGTAFREFARGPFYRFPISIVRPP